MTPEQRQQIKSIFVNFLRRRLRVQCLDPKSLNLNSFCNVDFEV